MPLDPRDFDGMALSIEHGGSGVIAALNQATTDIDALEAKGGWTEATGATSGAETVAIATATIDDDSAGTIEAVFTAKKHDDHSVVITYRRTVSFRKTGGSLTLADTNDDVDNNTDLVAADAMLTDVSDNIAMNGIGVAANNLSWHVLYRIMLAPTPAS